MRHLHLLHREQVLPTDIAEMGMDEVRAQAAAEAREKSRRRPYAEALRDPFRPKPPVPKVAQGM
jgi:hypothetical protein